jgi:hypothetical protein
MEGGLGGGRSLVPHEENFIRTFWDNWLELSKLRPG